MVNEAGIKPFNIYFEKELRFFLIAIASVGLLGNLIDVFTYINTGNKILYFNFITIAVMCSLVFLYIIKKHSLKLSFILLIYSMLANLILGYIMDNPSKLVDSFFLRESIFFILLLTLTILFVNLRNGLIILVLYIGFYIYVMTANNSEFLSANIYLIFLMVVSYTIVIAFFSNKLNNAIVDIQRDRALINEQNEELRSINNELFDSHKLISAQNEELISLSESLHNQSNLIEIKNKDLEEAIKSKNIFFSIIAHDLKSPIGSMTELTSLMLERYDTLSDEKKQHWIKNIYKSSKLLLELLENLLLWSRMNLGVIKSTIEEVSIYKSIDKLKKIFNQALTQKKLSLNIEIQEDLIVRTDKMMIETICRNLISNAIKFSNENGQIDIHIDVKNNNYLSLIVQDHGIGMSEEVLAKIEKIEYKYSTLGTAGEKGTGLGLHLCRLFVAKLGGEFNISSELGQGTEIVISIPV